MPTELGFRSIHSESFEAVAEDNPLPVQVIEPVPVADPPATFRVAFSIAAVSGDAIELKGDDGKIIKITEVAIAKPSVDETVILIKRQSADSGGTSTDATVVAMDSEDSASGVIKLYTAAPTAGAAIGNLARCVVGPTDVMVWDFARLNTKPPTLRRASESFCINVDASATFPGWIEWTEEVA